MAMPPEHLQHSRADDSSDTNMLGVSVMNTTQQPQHIQSTSTNAGGEYSLHTSSKTNASKNSYNHSHSSVMNGHGNPSREANKDDPKRSKPISTTNHSLKFKSISNTII